jgi:hypothetical protein
MSNLAPIEQLICLIDSPFYSYFYECEVMVKEDATLWDIETNTLLESVLTDELLDLLYTEWL